MRKVLKQAVTFILFSQDANGSWRYTPDPEDGDVSVTTCQMMALASARQAGIAVPHQAIQRGIDFLRRCQNPDGGFRYRLTDPPYSLWPRTAAAVATLHAIGLHEDPMLVAGRAYLASRWTVRLRQAPAAEYYFYGRLYATPAAWQARGATWDHWYPAVRDELLPRQTSIGCWTDSTICDEYATAMALLILQFPLDSLPLHLL